MDTNSRKTAIKIYKIFFNFFSEILKEEIKSVLSTLQPREQQVLELRFGLIDGTSYTLEEVGKRFNFYSFH